MSSRISVVVLGVAALSLSPMASTSLDGVLADSLSMQAHAKGGNGNGGGNGGGNGNGGGANDAGGGNAGDHGRGGGRGKSAERGGQDKGNGSGNGKGLGDFFGGMFGARDDAKSGRSHGRSGTAGTARQGGSKGRSLAEQQQAALKGKALPTPEFRAAKERNLHAKLAGLNSLNRNYHAYLNAKDPKLAAIQAYVLASAQYEIDAKALDDLEAELAAAETQLAAYFAGIETFDAYSYDTLDQAALADRLATLETTSREELDEAQLAALDAELEALNAAIESQSVATVEATSAEIAEIEAAAELTDEEALKEALLAGANANRLAEYGEESYVDQDMLDWASGVLGVGEEYGKIDQVREALEAKQATEDAEAVTEDGLVDG